MPGSKKALRKILTYFIMKIVIVALLLLLLVPNWTLSLPVVASVEGQAGSQQAPVGNDGLVAFLNPLKSGPRAWRGPKG